MHFSLATIIAVVPLLVSASPLAKQPYSTISLVRNSNLHQEDGSIDAEKLKGHLAASVDKFMRSFETYQRSTGKRHPLQPDVDSTGTKRDFAEAGITKMLWHHWMARVTVGTPPQPFWLEVDTGSSDLVIPDESCKDTCSDERYKSDASSTSKALGRPFSIERFHSVVSGNLYTDTVSLVSDRFVVANQTLGAGSKYTQGLSARNGGPDGLLGLGFPIVSVFDAPTVLENLVAQRQATDSIFALWLNGESGELTLGGINPNLFTGTPIYAPVSQDGFWEIKLSSVKVGDSDLTGPTHAVLDSGSMLVVGPKAAVQAIYARIQGSKEVKDTPGFFTFPCASRIPPISVTFGKNELFMDPETVNFGPISRGSDTCKGSIVYEEKFGNAAWILGNSFMANFYTIFDFDKKQIGFAKPNRNPSD